MIRDYFNLAYNGAKQRKMRSLLTMIGIFVGIAAVVALLSLSQGLKTAVAEQFIAIGSDKVVVQASGGGFGPPGAGVPVHLTEEDEDVIKKVQGVDFAVGRLVRTVEMEFSDEQLYTFAVSMPSTNDEIELAIEVNNYELVEGRMLSKDSANEVVLGYDIAHDFFAEDIELRQKMIIQGAEFKVVGILEDSGNPQRDSSVVIPENDLLTLLGIENEYDLIGVKISGGEDLNVVSERLERALRKSHNVEEGKEDFEVQTPDQILETLNSILLIIQGVLVGIAAISLVVGGIGIMNTMYTAVVERTKEIGIMKAVGATQKEIMTLFLIESGFLGLFGGIVGVILGLLISKSVELAAAQALGASLLQAEISFPIIFGALFFSFIIGAISGVLPSRQAAKLTPVEALRK
ncbi:ABC transporter permease [Candidatus Woesearchaeota archaeon]|nr:ABC transporter permease [Candidatus Woesearchaeota archaeon]